MNIRCVPIVFVVWGSLMLGQACRGEDLSVQIQRCEELTRQAPSSGNLWFELAVLDQDAGRYTAADAAYRRAAALLKPADSLAYATAIDRWGTMYAERGKYTEAESVEQEALGIRTAAKDLHGEGLSWMHLAMLALGRHELASASRYADMAVNRLVPEREHLGATGPATPEEKMTALVYISLVRFAQGNYRDAMPEIRLARTLAQESHGEGSFPDAFLEFLLGKAYWKTGDDARAEELMRAGVNGVESELGWGHATYVSMLQEYETFLKERGRMAEAAEIEVKRAHLASRDSRGDVLASNRASR
ncbi:MAG TPA: tetratricopeptide repeat protein [Acidobacteriaceae bacterium]|jgi:tetratricopeptide (TPR) repeat protein